MNASVLEEGPRNAPSPRGGTLLVSLYSWTCLVVTVAVARGVITLHQKVAFRSDDAAAFVGTFVYLGATASWHVAIVAGLGKHFNQLSSTNAERYFEAAYSAELLQIVAMALAKTSSILLIERVAPQTRNARRLLFGVVGFWFVYSMLATALQCGLPAPWRVGAERCGHGALLISVVALNMASDLLVAGWILPVLCPLKMGLSGRIIVGVLFGARVVVVVVAGGQAWAVRRAFSSNDPTWDRLAYTLFSHAVTSLSLIVATIPRIKRFLDTAGGDSLRPLVTEAEIALSARATTGTGTSVSGEPLKLVPSSTAKVTTTVRSDGSQRQKQKQKAQHEWERFVTMGSQQDEHTSTSSLFEHQGVMKHQEVTVEIEH